MGTITQQEYIDAKEVVEKYKQQQFEGIGKTDLIELKLYLIEFYSFYKNFLTIRSRKRTIVLQKHIYFYLLYHKYSMTLSDISINTLIPISTVRNGIKQIENMIIINNKELIIYNTLLK